MTVRRSQLFALVSLALVPACDESTSDPLEGREFINGTVDGYSLVPGSSIRFAFREGELSASTGCNTMSGAYDLADRRLRVDSLGSTEAGCEPFEYHAQDDWLAGFLMAAPEFSLQEPHLVLTNGSATITATDREVADPDRPLVGTQWVLDAIIDGGGAGFGDWPETVLQFTADGTFAIEAGCPTASGSYTVDGDALTFTAVSTSTDACGDAPTSVVDVTTSVLSDGEVTFMINASNLTLMRGDAGLSFSAAAN